MSSSSKSILLYPILINLRQPANSQLYLLFRQVCLSVAQLASQLPSQISKQLDGTSKLLLIRVATYLPSQLPYPVGWFILLCESDVKAMGRVRGLATGWPYSALLIGKYRYLGVGKTNSAERLNYLVPHSFIRNSYLAICFGLYPILYVASLLMIYHSSKYYKRIIQLQLVICS